MGVSNPPNLEENLSFYRGKTALQCASAGEFTEPRTIAKLLLLKNRSQKKNVHRVNCDTPKQFMKLRP